MKKYFKSSWLAGVILQALCAILILSTSASAADRTYLWQSREQFVALERAESDPSKPVPPNDHPAVVSADRLTGMMETLSFRATGSQKPDALLTPQSIQILAPLLQEALQQAKPGEDITFAVIGLYNSLYGFAKSPKVTTGRVFVRSGSLNIIFGQLQQEVRDRDDRRLYPFISGSWNEVAAGDWSVRISDQPGASLVRKDWVAFGSVWQPAVKVVPAQEPGKPGAVSPPSQTQKGAKIDSRSPADRLNVLKELKDNGLISGDEYSIKRMEILNSL
jgi:hypothetical protein